MAEAIAETPRLTRREFLYYIWFGSMAMAMGGSTAAVLWFAYPIIPAGEFGSEIFKSISDLPEANSGPNAFESVKLWLVRTDAGMLAIYKVCTHLGCLYKWVPTNFRFECPCHGSKFQLDGTYIEGPAPRSLDRFAITLKDEAGNELASGDDGKPLPVPDGTAEIVIDTGDKILGEVHD